MYGSSLKFPVKLFYDFNWKGTILTEAQKQEVFTLRTGVSECLSAASMVVLLFLSYT